MVRRSRSSRSLCGLVDCPSLWRYISFPDLLGFTTDNDPLIIKSNVSAFEQALREADLAPQGSASTVIAHNVVSPPNNPFDHASEDLLGRISPVEVKISMGDDALVSDIIVTTDAPGIESKGDSSTGTSPSVFSPN